MSSSPALTQRIRVALALRQVLKVKGLPIRTLLLAIVFRDDDPMAI